MRGASCLGASVLKGWNLPLVNLSLPSHLVVAAEVLVFG